VFLIQPRQCFERQGWNLDVKHADGVNILSEVVWSPKQGVNDLPGSYRIGTLYNTADEAKNQYDVAIKQELRLKIVHMAVGLRLNSN
jgi:porin